MQAAVLLKPGNASVATVPRPEPGPHQVRVRLEGCGICGSNLAPWEGRPWFTYPFAPGAPGHEGWGHVDAVGSDVRQVKSGDRVALLSYYAFAEYDVADETAVVALPPALDRKPFPGEALGCAFNVFRRSRIAPRQTVAVIGIGFLGALLTALAARAGANVIAISRRDSALELAKHFGASALIWMGDHHGVIDKVLKLTDGIGCACTIEAVGLQGPLDLAGEITREQGRLVIAGYHQDGPRQVNMQLWNWRGFDVVNAHERDTRVYVEGIQAAVQAVTQGILDPAPLFTHSFSLSELAQGLNALTRRPDGFMKGLLIL